MANRTARYIRQLRAMHHSQWRHPVRFAAQKGNLIRIRSMTAQTSNVRDVMRLLVKMYLLQVPSTVQKNQMQWLAQAKRTSWPQPSIRMKQVNTFRMNRNHLTELSENHEFIARNMIERAKRLNIMFRDERTCAWLGRILENTRKMFPRAKLFLYGSRFYQLSDDHSDVNIYVDMGKSIWK